MPKRYSYDISQKVIQAIELLEFRLTHEKRPSTALVNNRLAKSMNEL